jgi:hypothetical protein
MAKAVTGTRLKDQRVIALAELIELYKRECGKNWLSVFTATVKIDMR